MKSSSSGARRVCSLAILVLAACGCGQASSSGTMSAAGTQQPPDSSRRDGDLSGLLDRPLATMPAEPVPPRFVIEHRSALNGKTIKVRGTVVRVIEPDDGRAPAGGGVAPRPGRFAQPRIVLADGAAPDRDTRYDLVILLREGDGGFVVGEVVDAEGTVDGNQKAVVVRRLYPGM